MKTIVKLALVPDVEYKVGEHTEIWATALLLPEDLDDPAVFQRVLSEIAPALLAEYKRNYPGEPTLPSERTP